MAKYSFQVEQQLIGNLEDALYNFARKFILNKTDGKFDVDDNEAYEGVVDFVDNMRATIYYELLDMIDELNVEE